MEPNNENTIPIKEREAIAEFITGMVMELSQHQTILAAVTGQMLSQIGIALLLPRSEMFEELIESSSITAMKHKEEIDAKTEEVMRMMESQMLSGFKGPEMVQ